MTDHLWFRRVVILAAACLLMGLGGSLAFRLAETVDPADDVDSVATATPSPQENAAEWLMAGAAAVVWSEDDTEAIGDASLVPFADWSPELERSVREALERQRGALETLHHAAPLASSSYGIDDPEGAAATMPDMLSLIKACRLLLAETRVSAADDDEHAALLALATMGKLASSLERESSMLTALVGIACERMMLRAAAETLTSGHSWTMQSAFFDALRNALSTEDLAATMRRSWRFESSHGADTGAAAGIEEVDVDRALALLSQLVETPYGVAPERFRRDGADDPPISLMIKNMSTAIARAQATLAQRQLVLAAIELRRIALADGAYPADRSAVAELATPDPFTGRPLLYEIRADGSAVVALDGADTLLADIVVTSGAHIPPIELPAPSRS